METMQDILISYQIPQISDFMKQINFSFLGITVHCPGSPGHGSRFVENTAAEKLVSVRVMLQLITVCFFFYH